MSRRGRLASRPSLEPLEGRLVPAALTPADIQVAYGLNGLNLNGTPLTGASQTIAIVDAYNDPYAALELSVFDREWGLPASKLTVDNLGSASNIDIGWDVEEALDIEAAHLAAPGANIDLVEAKSDSLTDLLAAVNVASTLTDVTIVSMSWGGGDFRGETADDADFNHTSLTYLAASGDEGAGAEWPADSPYVIGVGGTTLTVSSAGTATSQAAWVDSSGGTSRLEAEPSYQEVAQQTGRRSTPDVSADADPDDGLVIATVAGGGWIQVGGTSLSTPLWAGLIADANEGRFLEGKPPLDSTEALEDLYNAPSGSFTDITTGPRATISYDTSTGLGTPNAPTLVAALVGDPATTGSTTGNGVGGDQLPGGGGGTTDAIEVHPAEAQPAGEPVPGSRHAFATPGGYSEATGTWAGADVPLNSGQEAPDPYTPITLIQGDPESTYHAIDAAIESLGRDDP